MDIPDPAAFCDRVGGRLVGSLTLYCGDRHLAEELAQEALARAWERWPSVSRMASPEAWAFRTAMNLASSRFRRRRVERRALARMAGRDDVERDDATVLAVRAAVRALPPRQRAVVVARWYLGYGVAETAELLGCAPGTVKSTTHQALARLREAGLADDEDADDEDADDDAEEKVR